jgi:hypothetical protein
MKVLLDTNFLLMPLKFRVDLFSEIARLVEGKPEYVVLSSSLKELGSLGKADVVKKIVAKTKLVEATGKVDEAIAEYAVRENAVVCTNDANLRKRLKALGVKTIFLRGKGHLEMD